MVRRPCHNGCADRGASEGTGEKKVTVLGLAPVAALALLQRRVDDTIQERRRR